MLAGLCLLPARPAAAQTPPVYLQLSPTVKAVLYSPAPGSAARVAIVNMHEDGNRLAGIACTELVKRGFYVLCMNGRSDNNEALDFWNDLPLDVATGVKYLKETVKASKILLYGGSGGAPLMTFYQSVAQHGRSVCRSNNNSTPCHLQKITVPILILGMGGHYFLRDNEIHYELSASPDKEYVVVEGASHGIRPCKACETTPGQYSNTVKNTFDYMQKWINARF
jgi:hypothetical protein